MSTRSPAGRQTAASADRYIVLLAGLAVALLAGALVWMPGAAVDLADPAVLLLGAIGAVSVVFPLRFHHDGDVTGFNLTSAVSLTMLLLVQDAAVLPAVAVMTAIGYAVATRSLVKTVFNVAQVVVTLALGIAVGRVVLGGAFAGDVLSVRVLLAVVIAATVIDTTSGVLVSELLHRMGGGTRRQLFGDISQLALWVTISDIVIAVLLTILAERAAVAVVLALPMFAGLQLGYRGFLAEREAARRAQLLHDTSRDLLEAAVDEQALTEAVDGLRVLFGADRAYLATGEDGGPGWARAAISAVHRTGDVLLETEETSVLAVPVRLEGRVVGVLVLSGRRGLETWDAAAADLLSTVAGEIAATLRTRRLLRQVERERSNLMAEKGKLTDVLRSASDGIVVIDAGGRVEACNPAMATLLGRDEVPVGVPWPHVLHLEDEDGALLDASGDHPIGAALSGGGRVELSSAALRRPDGELRWLRCSAAPVLSDGQADGVVLVAVDVTRERELDQLRSDFIATVSHELRTPLTPLRGFLTVLREHGGAIDEDRRHMMVTAMENQVDRLSDLVGDLLQVAEMDRGLVRLEREAVPLDAAITEVVELEAVAAADRGRLRLDVEPVDVIGDRQAVRRIVRALVSNGLKHTEGVVTVRAGREGHHAVVRVRDEGPRIPQGARDVVFEPFRRLGDHLRRTQGSGLGLTVSRSLAESLGGSLEVIGAPGGVGNEFVLRLPAAASRGQDVVELRPGDTA